MSAVIKLSDTPPSIPDHELFRRIGKGAYGEVWLAQNVMGTWRAVKIVWRDVFGSERPYEREFMGIKRFEPVSRSQDSQVDVLHVGRNDREGYFYYVMELADDVQSGQQIDSATYEARTLRSEMERRGRFSVSKCLDVGITLCGALEHLHTNGLVHRDIKPSNIIFVHGRPKLADIGLVAAFDEAISFVGTEGFVPPEGPGTPQADLFSLGKVLYELHTGFDRKNFPELPASTGSEDDPNLSQELNLIILKACAPAMRMRHGTVKELREELQLLQSGRSIKRLRQAESRALFFRRFGLVAIGVAAVALVGYISALRANLRADANAREAKAELLKARYSQARAVRLSGQAGRRAEALAAIREAAAVRPSRELRDEAIATLAITDLEPSEVFMPHPPDALVKAQGNPARSVFSDDLNRVAWCNLDGSVSIVRVPDGREERRLPPVGEGISALGSIWSPDGRYLAVSYRGEVRVWEVGTARMVCSTATAVEPTEAGAPASFSADGTHVALQSLRAAFIYELPSGKALRRTLLPEDTFDFRLHPEEPWLATCANKDMLVIDYETREVLKTYSMFAAVLGVQWSPDGSLLGAMLRDGALFVADVRSRNKIRLPGRTERPVHLTFSPDGTWMASVYRDGTTRLWNALAGGPPASTTLHGLVQKFSSDGKRLGYTRADGVGIWNLVEPDRFYAALVGRLGFDLVEHVTFSPDGKWMVSMSEGPDGLWIWDLATRQLVASSLGAGPRRQWLNFTPDGKRLLTLGKDGLNAWPVRFVEGRLDLGPAEPIPLEADSIVSDVAAISADGKTLVARVRPQRALIIDLEKNGVPTPIDTEVELRSIGWAPDGKRLAVGTHRGAGTHVIDINGFRDVRVLGDTDSHVAYSPDGKWLVSFTSSQCEFYHASTLRLAKAFPRLQIERNPGTMGFSADGRFFGYLKRRSQVELINSQNLESLATFELPDGNTADTLDFSPDGQWLAIHDKARCHLYHLPTLRSNLRDLGLDW